MCNKVASVLCFWVFWPPGMWDPSSLTRDCTLTACIGRQNPNHWTTRQVPAIYFLNRKKLGYLFAACGEHTIRSQPVWGQGFGLYWVSTSRGQWGRTIPSKLTLPWKITAKDYFACCLVPDVLLPCFGIF